MQGVLMDVCVPHPPPPPSYPTLQFLDQENRMSRRQLMEVEAKLQSTLAELQERSLQHEELLEAHQNLQYGFVLTPATRSLGVGQTVPLRAWGGGRHSFRQSSSG